MKKHLLTYLLLLYLPFVYGQSSDSTILKLAQFAYTVENFGKLLPQEKVYLHFDNTSYYQGDNIWFQCYVVSSEGNSPTRLSRTLYVELLNSGGDIISKQILPIKNGRCHGEFSLTHLPFYSGFYEIRAYTKYMLNFGEDQIYSRVIPVFDKPKENGDYTDKRLLRNSNFNYHQKRKKTKHQSRINLKFYPEGGNLVEGIRSRVAFEATNSVGEPVSLSGMVVDREGKDITAFSTLHDGRGVFFYEPSADNKDKAVVEYAGEKFKFDLPKPLSQGVILSVDNLMNKDSLIMMIQKNAKTAPHIMGLAFMNCGKLYKYMALNVNHNNMIRFKIDKSVFPSGVTRVVLFDEIGQIVADRLLFVRQPAQLAVSIKKNKETYEPFDNIDLDISVRDSAGQPVTSPLSVSVRDGFAEVDDGGRSILTDLLLMSEIKGYVNHPDFYFESEDYMHRQALDLLLMVQGWRRYDWKYWAGLEPFDLKYLPELGIEVHGKVVSFVRNKPRGDVEISAYLTKRSRLAEYESDEEVEEEDGEDGQEPVEDEETFLDLFKTDSTGHFSFVTDVQGKWNLILSVAKKGKRKDYKILLDRLFSPQPEKYQLGDLQVRLVKDSLSAANNPTDDTTSLKLYDFNELIDSYEDSLRKQGIHEKIQRLDEVVVKADKDDYEKQIHEVKSTSSVYYDVQSEIEEIKDRGGYLGNDIIELLTTMDRNFTRYRKDDEEYVRYKGRNPLFVIDYEPVLNYPLEYIKYKFIALPAIKSIYINEDPLLLRKYTDPSLSAMTLDTMFYGIVFIETWPESVVSARPGKGVRKTWLDGYSEVKEFYHKDYSKLPKDEDYRRTLYWNPEVLPDSTGRASIHFYNNSRCRKIRISAETLSDKGITGKYSE